MSMRSIKKEDHVKLREALAAAYREKEKAEMSGLWQVRVMGHIRDLGPFYLKTGYLDLFQGFVWRLAPVACLLVFLLSVILSQFHFVSDYKMAKVLIEDPANFSLFALYK
jgi:hypothetical protein